MRYPIKEEEWLREQKAHILALAGHEPVDADKRAHWNALRAQLEDLLRMKRDLEERLAFSESRRAAAAHNRMQERR